MRKGFDMETKLANAFSEISHICKCGHVVHIQSNIDFVYCDWCGRKVYKNDLVKFKRKLLAACGKVNHDQVSQ